MGDNLPIINLGTDGLGNQLKIKKIVAAFEHTCVQLTNNKVKCFGKGFNGRLGYENTNNLGFLSTDMGDNLQYVGLASTGTATVYEIESIYSGDDAQHTCVIMKTAQTMKCWGFNNAGQLGYGDISDRGHASNTMGNNLLEIDLGTIDAVKSISVDNQQTCAIRTDDVVKCWGLNEYGQLGVGDTTDPYKETGDSLPALLIDSGSKKAVIIECGYEHTCIVLDDYLTLKCVGRNNIGQLGQGDTN